MALSHVKGNILQSKATYIVHQTNCVSQGSKGLAREIFLAFPWANSYRDRKVSSIPGTIELFGDGKSKRFVVNLYGQKNPGPIEIGSTMETYRDRESWFEVGLKSLLEHLQKDESVAFPDQIGCGLAKGHWPTYLHMIETFALECQKKQVAVELVTFSSLVKDVHTEVEKKVLVCGDRNYTNYPFVKSVLDTLDGTFRTLVEGGASGADTLAGEWAKSQSTCRNWKLVVYPADWKTHGKKAGPIRNLQMIEEKPKLVIAFHDNLDRSKGTKSMIEIAHKHDVLVLHASFVHGIKVVPPLKKRKLIPTTTTPSKVLPFGQHKGKTVQDPSIPTRYLEWMLQEHEKDANSFADWAPLCQRELLRRSSSTTKDIRLYFTSK